jgi:metal-responsive CopG/Arc/MetJ family transcriptional regulator
MKTAISLPDEVFEAAEELADELGVSRSQLYAQAVAEYVAQHRHESVTARLDEVHGEVESALDPVLEELQARSVGRGGW